jgi:uncharacterized protein
VTENVESNVVRPELMAILVCPESKAKLVQVGEWLYSTDPATRRRYSVRDGIPNMLIDESTVVSEEEFRQVMAQSGVQVQGTGDSAGN